MKRVQVVKIFLTGLALLLAGGPAWAELKPEALLAKADAARGSHAGIQWTVDIHSVENGRTNQRTLLLKAKNHNSLAQFIAPAKVKGRQVLMRDRNMWFIKPGLKKPIPISPRQKLIGGASNGDIATTNYVDDYSIAKVGEGIVGDEACYVMDLVAKNKKVTYAKIRYWVSKTRSVGVKAEFFTVSGKIFKTATFDYGNQVTVDRKTYPFVSKMTIIDSVATDNVTVMSYGKIKVRPVSDATFNLNLLVR